MKGAEGSEKGEIPTVWHAGLTGFSLWRERITTSWAEVMFDPMEVWNYPGKGDRAGNADVSAWVSVQLLHFQLWQGAASFPLLHRVPRFLPLCTSMCKGLISHNNFYSWTYILHSLWNSLSYSCFPSINSPNQFFFSMCNSDWVKGAKTV